MTRIVTTHHRYKRPPRKRKPVAIEAPAVVTAKSSRRPNLGGKTAAEVLAALPPFREEGATHPSTPREAKRVISPPHHSASPANDDRKPAIVTIKRKSRFGDAPDLTPDEHQRRGDAADAMWSGLVGRATAKDGKSTAVSAESSSPVTKPVIVTTARKRRSDAPHLPMELPLSRKPVEREGDDYKQMKAAMTRRLRPGGTLPPDKR